MIGRKVNAIIRRGFCSQQERNNSKNVIPFEDRDCHFNNYQDISAALTVFDSHIFANEIGTEYGLYDNIAWGLVEMVLLVH